MIPITVTYRVEFEDYERAQAFVYDPKRIGRIFILILAAGAAFALVVRALSGPRKDDWPWIAYALLLSVCIAALYGILLVFVPWAHRRRLRRLYDAPNARHAEITVSLSDEGLQARTALAESRLSWECFHKWKSTEEMLLIFQSATLFHMLPRRAFASQEDYDALRDLLTRKFGPAK